MAWHTKILSNFSVKQIFLYIVSVGSTLAANFALVLILVRILPPDGYAGLVLTKVSLLLVTSIAGLGLSQSAVRWANTDGRYGRIIGTALLGAAGLSIPATVVLAGIIIVYSSHLGLSLTVPLAASTLIVVSAYMINNEVVNWARACHQAGWHAALSCIRALVQLLTVSAAVYLMGGTNGFVVGLAIGELSFLLVFGGRLILQSSCCIHLLKDMLRYGWPFTFVIASSFLLIHIDRYMLAFLSTTQATVAYYDAAYMAVSSGLALLVRPFNLFLFPAYTKMYHEHGIDRTLTLIDQAQKVFLWTGIVMATGLVIYRAEILAILYPLEYSRADSVFAPVAFATLVNGVFMATAAGLYLSKRTLAVGMAAITAVIVNVGANMVLIPRWDMLGAAIATAIAAVIQIVIAHQLGRTTLPVPLPRSLLLGSAVWFTALSYT